MVRKPGLQCFFPRAFKENSKFVFDSDGRIFSVLIDFGSCKFNLVNVYAPNTVTGRKVFFSEFSSGFFCLLAVLLLGILNG